MKKILISIIFILLAGVSFASDNVKKIGPVPSDHPGKYQLEQIKRQYGMFIHFGINTFQDQEWTDGSVSPLTYTPKAIDAEQWIQTAKNGGMKYVILITKHHDGFCLWDSKYTNYDVASSPNKTNVLIEVAKACKKYDLGLGIYYSLWDRNKNGDTKDSALDLAYNDYLINQLKEIIPMVQKYTPIIEFWFDGGWEKPNYRWPVQRIYETIKPTAPQCQIGINWSIGAPGNPDQHMVLPQDQKDGYPIRYFPSDFRLGDPYFPANPDPKIFSHDGKWYYMPWESTVCMSQRWFYNTTDTTYKSVDELEKLYKIATAQENILILNCPPNREGKMREKDAELLIALKKRLKL